MCLQIEHLVSVEAAVNEELEKEKWVRIANQMKELHGTEWEPAFVKKTFVGIPKRAS